MRFSGSLFPMLSAAAACVTTASAGAVVARVGRRPAPSRVAKAAPAKLDFTRDVQPILKAHCFQCHSGAQKQGGLLLDTLEVALKGGASGPAIRPGDSRGSLFLERVLGHGGKPRMPLGFAPLSESKVAVLRAWIDQGAAWSEAAAAKMHWAYTPPVRPAVPKVKNAKWVRNPIDAFVLARLEKEGLQPSPQADRLTLLRRLYLDLIGLPPTPAEVEEFLGECDAETANGQAATKPSGRKAERGNGRIGSPTLRHPHRGYPAHSPTPPRESAAPSAYERLVDRLLANPHFGERLALPWLDAARYADSNGFQQDGDTYQYVWRDWVVRALNSDMPFDQFTIEQLAGDLLPNATLDQQVATGFNRCHLLNGEGGAIPEEQRTVILFDRVDVTATTWLGATLACAQCHDHKYDPYTQRDYYQLMAFFNNVPESGTPPFGGQYRIADPWIYAGTPEQTAKLKEFDQRITAAKSDAEKKAVEKERDAYRTEVPRVMVMSDARPRKTHLLQRGNYEMPGPEVQANTPGCLPPLPADAPRNRLGLAKWLVSPENPLTARVQVNRFWQYFFGQGLVKTSENLGTQCEPPTHPLLLDWLASTFAGAPTSREVDGETAGQRDRGTLDSVAGPSPRERTDRQFSPSRRLSLSPSSSKDVPAAGFASAPEYGCGWSMKKLVRLIVTSSTYRQSSKIPRALRQRDPENRLLARGARFRMPSLVLRDVALASSGLLDPRIGGKPVYPYQPKGIWDGLAITKERDFTYPQSKGADLFRRSLYTFWRRTVAPANMFDASVRNTCKVRLSVTSTPLHALTTLNDVTWVEAGRALAERAMKASPDPDSRLIDAFRRVCTRVPSAAELRVLRRGLERGLSTYRADRKAAEEYLKSGESPRDASLDAAEHAAYATVCLSIFNLDEALTRE